MRTPEEVKKQIEGLTKMKEWLPERSGFGTPNHEKIDAQISILDGSKDVTDIDEGDWDEMDEQNEIYRAAEDADEWMNETREEDLFETQGEK